MKNIYLILFSALSSFGFSQTTLTKAANDYLTGNTINSKNLVGTPDNSAVGAAVTFDNSALTNGTLIAAQVSTPNATEISTFPGTTVKFEDGNGNSIFYKSTATQLEITGAGISGATLNFSADNALFLKFPTSFGNTYTDNARGTFTSTAASGLFKGTITTTADGSGTLLLGSQTFTNVLRVKTVQNYNLYQSTDTTYFFSIGTLLSTFYTYYNATLRYPIFTTTTATISVPLLSINQTTNAAVAQNIPLLATDQTSLKSKISVYPNPVKDELFFSGDLSKYNAVKVLSVDGKLLRTELVVAGKIDLSKLSAGNYILQLSGKNLKDQTIHIIKK